MHERAARSGADTVILDLEDGVADRDRARARQVIAGSLDGVDFGSSERAVRLSGVPAFLATDLEAAATADAVVIPKVEHPTTLRLVASTAADVLGRVPPIIAIIESGRGFLATPALGEVEPWTAAWMWGSEDLAADLGCRPRAATEPFRDPLAMARAATVILAGARREQAIDAVYPFVKDIEGLRGEAASAAEAGFSGKGVIHPAQIEPVHDAFEPSESEVVWARAVAEAFACGEPVAQLDGQMLDRPHLRAAERILGRAGVATVPGGTEP